MVGVVIAVSVRQAHVVLFVGAVLLILATIGPLVEEMELKRGTDSIKFRLGRLHERAALLSASTRLPESLRQEISELAADLAVLRELEAEARPRRLKRVKRASEFITHPKFLGIGEFEVELKAIDGVIRGDVRCIVVAPDGSRSVAPVSPLFGLAAMHGSHIVRFSYPRDFKDAPPMVPGHYYFSWTVSAADDEDTEEVAFGAFLYEPDRYK